MSKMGNLVLDIQEHCVDVINGHCSVDTVAKVLGVPVDWVQEELDRIEAEMNGYSDPEPCF